jgi:catechol 2,3-dioxygenase-like lactoylglutathione lyase family enzyme
MHVRTLGHVVLTVRDLERSEIFYSDILGMRVVSRISDPPMTFFRTATSDHHHDFALMELSPHALITSSSDQIVGLAHVAFKVGRSAEELRHARSVLDASGIRCLYEADRAFAKSVHVLDPDGNEVELYIESLGHPEG